jgi:hypothetical protein
VRRAHSSAVHIRIVAGKPLINQRAELAISAVGRWSLSRLVRFARPWAREALVIRRIPVERWNDGRPRPLCLSIIRPVGRTDRGAQLSVERDGGRSEVTSGVAGGDAPSRRAASARIDRIRPPRGSSTRVHPRGKVRPASVGESTNAIGTIGLRVDIGSARIGHLHLVFLWVGGITGARKTVGAGRETLTPVDLPCLL